MAQLTIRTDDELVARVRTAAADAGRSMNEWVTTVLVAATDPDTEDHEITRIRARLRLAGLLAEIPTGTEPRPDVKAVRDAGHRAGRGTPVADLVSEDRR